MTTTEIATIDLVEDKARRRGSATVRGLRVWDVDNSTNPAYTLPGFVYLIDFEPVSRERAECYLAGRDCGPLAVCCGDPRDTWVLR